MESLNDKPNNTPVETGWESLINAPNAQFNPTAETSPAGTTPEATPHDQLLAVPTPLDKMHEKFHSGDPVDMANVLMVDLRDRQPRRLLGLFADAETTTDENGTLQFTRQAFENVHPGGQDLVNFLNKYPSPGDFEPLAEQLIAERITDRNPAYTEQKKSEYRAAAKELMGFAYGDRYVVYQMQKMQAEDARIRAAQAEELARERERLAALSPEEREQLARDQKLGVVSISKNERTDFNNLYLEQNPNAGHLRRGAAPLEQRFETTREGNEDAFYLNDEKQIFAVFDGAGGAGGAREASQTALRAVADYAEQYIFKSDNDLRWVLDNASQAVYNNPAAGLTTGVIANITTDDSGRKLLNYAAIGDSRLYLIPRGEAEAYLVTQDETADAAHSNAITNSLGGQKYHQPGTVQNGNYGQIEVHKGDKILICTDGLTGDTPAQSIESRIGQVIWSASSARTAAEALASISQKTYDDLTAIIREVE